MPKAGISQCLQMRLIESFSPYNMYMNLKLSLNYFGMSCLQASEQIASAYAEMRNSSAENKVILLKNILICVTFGAHILDDRRL